ncbi:MAG: TonB-dependent receptor [Chitinophagales bacterium]|nr:TonB-dependent receptor [Chitinophagales bacterium]
MKLIISFCLSLILSSIIFAENIVIKGNVKDKENETLIGANVIIVGTTIGTVTDIDGNFTIEGDITLPAKIEISYLGYATQSFDISSNNQSINVILTDEALKISDEVVISASRISEKITESPSSIQKLSAKQIQAAASGDFYQSLGNLKEIDITTSSMGFQVFNTRGFNTTAPVRVVQFIDGMDNQAPGLNFPVGNLVGASDLDLQSVEIISGASSALYGANAFQGIIAMETKSPFDYDCLQFKVKGGSNAMFNGQLRYAKAFGKKKWGKDKIGFKITGEYFRAKDWIADDAEANTYGDVTANVNVSQVVRQLQYGADSLKFTSLNAYLDFYPEALPGYVEINAPGYREKELSDNNTNSIKASFGLYAKPNDDVDLEYLYKFGRGTAIYQGSNRYSVKNILFQQHKIEAQWKGLNVKAYTTLENAGDSYDLVFGAINLSKVGFTNFVGNFIRTYFEELSNYTNEFSDDPELDDIAVARADAIAYAYENSFLVPGTSSFDSAYSIIKNDADFKTGAKFQDKSSLQHVEASYTHDFKKTVNLIGGASFRNYIPQSYGTIFEDSLMPDGKYKNLNTWEVGAFTQLTVNLFNDKLKLIGSARIDKPENFKLQFSPRISAVANFKKNTFRVSYQQAFRSPTLQNQYIYLDVGAITLKGNLYGNDGYTIESVNDYYDNYQNTLEIDPSRLKTIQMKPLKPEQVNSVEVGYRGSWFKNFYIDMNAYFNRYFNFIGDIRFYRSTNDDIVIGSEQGNDAMLIPIYRRLYQIPVNAQQKVDAWGFSVGINYYLYKSLVVSANYTYADLNTKNLVDPIIPGFNTPNNKFNIGLSASKIWKGFGFAANFKWVQSYYWESTFGDGEVPSYHTLDMQVNYEFKKFITLQVGGSNIYNNKYKTAYGSPEIGAQVYGALSFDLSRGIKKKN